MGHPAITCTKCGSDDVNTTYHRSDIECTWQQRSRAGFQRFGEHLHRNCRYCGFDWPTDVVDTRLSVARPKEDTRQ